VYIFELSLGVTEPPLLSLVFLVSPVPGSSSRPPEAPGSSVPHLRQQQHPTPPYTAHRWVGNKVEFLVKWNLGDSTWEPHAHCRDLEALDDYLELHGAQLVQRLPKGSQRTRSMRE